MGFHRIIINLTYFIFVRSANICSILKKGRVIARTARQRRHWQGCLFGPVNSKNFIELANLHKKIGWKKRRWI